MARRSKSHSVFRFPLLGGSALATLYVGVTTLPLLLAAAHRAAPLDALERLASGLGLVGLTAMAIQFLTSGRFRSFSGRLGIDKIMAFHKVAAWWVLLAVMFHPILYVLPAWLDDPEIGVRRLTAFLVSPHYRTGLISLVAILVLVLTSVLRERLPARYEFWRASHVLIAVSAAGTGIHHAMTTGRFSATGAVHIWWWGAAALLVLVMAVLYGWRWFLLHFRPWRLESVTRLADRIWELDIQPIPGTPDLSYDAGQFVWITEGSKRFPLFDHPFSIADAPDRPGISLIIKEAGDFTNGVGLLNPGTPIGIDGPHGEFSLAHHPGRVILLVAGGAGIGPIMGLLRDLVARRDPRSVRLAYAVGQPSKFACLEELEEAKAVLDFDILLVSETSASGYNGKIGRLDRDLLEAFLKDVDPRDCLAMICGPGPMVVALADALGEIGLPENHIIYERFDYSAGSASRQDRSRLAKFFALGVVLALAAGLFAVAPSSASNLDSGFWKKESDWKNIETGKGDQGTFP